MPTLPSPADLDAARGRRVRDVLGPDLDVVFCGINPGLYSAAVGHHFARPGNRFWKALEGGGFTRRLWSPEEDGDLPSIGLGITNLVGRATARAAELDRAELRAGAARLRRLARRNGPRCVAILGIDAYRTAFDDPRAAIGRQEAGLENGLLWVLPNPSGLNAHFQLPQLSSAFAGLRRAIAMR
ncbi:MAG TPA: G/U mismatch-specific DNA glycosylase [Actinomycetota bacterium]|nr:G/U mismatch-specific DNA glycosylase [Actinomycetota bacterium]